MCESTKMSLVYKCAKCGKRHLIYGEANGDAFAEDTPLEVKVKCKECGLQNLLSFGVINKTKMAFKLLKNTKGE